MSSSSHPTYLVMVYTAVGENKDKIKGASRAAIASYIKSNYDGLAEGARFNATLRRTLKDGVENDLLEHGASHQRYKVTDKGKEDRDKGGEKPRNSAKKKKSGAKKGKTKTKNKGKRAKEKPKKVESLYCTVAYCVGVRECETEGVCCLS